MEENLKLVLNLSGYPATGTAITARDSEIVMIQSRS